MKSKSCFCGAVGTRPDWMAGRSGGRADHGHSRSKQPFKRLGVKGRNGGDSGVMGTAPREDFKILFSFVLGEEHVYYERNSRLLLWTRSSMWLALDASCKIQPKTYRTLR